MTQEFTLILVYSLYDLTYICIALLFCKSWLEITKINQLLFLVLSACYRLILSVMTTHLTISPILPGCLLFIGFIMAMFQGNPYKKLLIATMLTAVTTLVENFFISLFSCLALFDMHIVKNIALPLIYGWVEYIISYVSLFMTAAALYLTAKHCKSIFYGKPQKWYILLTIPLLFIIAVMNTAGWGASHGIMVRSGGDMGLYYDQLFSHAEFCVLSLLCLLSAAFYVFGMDRIYLEQQKSSQYHSQISAYQMLEEQYSRSERLRHDLKNHVIALSGLLENNEWEKMDSYLKSMADSADLNACCANTGSRVVDALLEQTRRRARERNILWECDVLLPKTECIEEFDLCVLFGNILDNAVEACEKLFYDKTQCISQPFISIQARTIKKCLLITAKNSTAASTEGKKRSTDKKGLDRHGIGLLNVKDMVHKYSGTMDTKVQDGVFEISFLIPLQSSPNPAAHDTKQAV